MIGLSDGLGVDGNNLEAELTLVPVNFTPPAVILNLCRMKHFKHLMLAEDCMVGSLRSTRYVYKLANE